MLRLVYTTMVILILHCGLNYSGDGSMHRNGSHLALLNADDQQAEVDVMITRLRSLSLNDQKKLLQATRSSVALLDAPGSTASLLEGDIDPTSSDESIRVIRTRRANDAYARMRRWACCACAGTAIAMSLAANLMAAGFVGYIAKDLLDSSQSCSSRLDQVSGDIEFAHDVVKTVKGQCPKGFETFEAQGIQFAEGAMNLITQACSGTCDKKG